MVKSTQLRDEHLNLNFLRIRVSVKSPFCIAVSHWSGCTVVFGLAGGLGSAQTQPRSAPLAGNKGTREFTGCAVGDGPCRTAFADILPEHQFADNDINVSQTWTAAAPVLP